MLQIFLRAIKDRKVSLLIYCIAGIAVLWMYVGLYPSIQEQAEEIAKLFESYPEGLRAVFGIENFEMDTLEKFLALEQLGLIWGIMAIFMVSSIAGGSISGEIDKGTIEILLSKPISRIRIFLARYAAGIVSLVIFAFFSIFAIFPLAMLHSVKLSEISYVYLFIISVMFAFTVFSMAMMFSALFSERGRTYMLVGMILGAMYLLNVASALVERLELLRYLSFFYHFDHGKALVAGELNVSALAVFAILSILFTLIGVAWFNKRDIAV